MAEPWQQALRDEEESESIDAWEPEELAEVPWGQEFDTSTDPAEMAAALAYGGGAGPLDEEGMLVHAPAIPEDPTSFYDDQEYVPDPNWAPLDPRDPDNDAAILYNDEQIEPGPAVTEAVADPMGDVLDPGGDAQAALDRPRQSELDAIEEGPAPEAMVSEEDVGGPSDEYEFEPHDVGPVQPGDRTLPEVRGEIERTRGAALAKRDRELALETEQELDFYRRAREKYETRKKEEDRKMAEARRRIVQESEKRLDTGRGWSNMSNVQKAASLISAAIEGWLNPGGKNRAVELLRSIVKDDIEAQKFEMQRGKDLAEQGYRMARDDRDIMNNEYEHDLLEAARRWESIKGHIRQQYARFEKGGTAAQNAERAYLEAETEQSRYLDEIQRRKNEEAGRNARNDAQQETSRRGQDMSLQREREAARRRREEEERNRRFEREEKEKDRAAALARTALTIKPTTAKPNPPGRGGELHNPDGTIDWNNPHLHKHKDAVKLTIGKNRDMVLGILRDPEMKTEIKQKWQQVNTDMPGMIERVNKFAMEARKFGSSYAGPGADLIGTPERKDLVAKYERIRADYVRAMSGTAASDKEREDLKLGFPSLESWLSTDPSQAWDSFRDELVGKYDRAFREHVIDKPGVDYMTAFFPPESNPTRQYSAEENLEIAGKSDAPVGSDDPEIRMSRRELALLDLIREPELFAGEGGSYDRVRQLESRLEENVRRLDRAGKHVEAQRERAFLWKVTEIEKRMRRNTVRTGRPAHDPQTRRNIEEGAGIE